MTAQTNIGQSLTAGGREGGWKDRLNHPVTWGGVVASVGISMFGAAMALSSLCVDGGECVSKWSVFLASRPNEIGGDTLTGFAGGALAFVWIIVTVWLQSIELAAQRVELQLARKEYERMAEAQEAQAKVIQKQGEIFEMEHRQRREDLAEKQLNAALRRLLAELDRVVASRFGGSPRTFEYSHGESIDANVGRLLKVLEGNMHFGDFTRFRMPSGLERIPASLRDELNSIRERLSPPEQESRWQLLRIDFLLNLKETKGTR